MMQERKSLVSKNRNNQTKKLNQTKSTLGKHTEPPIPLKSSTVLDELYWRWKELLHLAFFRNFKNIKLNVGLHCVKKKYMEIKVTFEKRKKLGSMEH